MKDQESRQDDELEGKSILLDIQPPFAAFAQRMWTAYKELEGSLMLLAFGGGATLTYKRRTGLPMPRPHLRYTSKVQWPVDAINRSLEKAQTALNQAQHSIQKLDHDSGTSKNLTAECRIAIRETMDVVWLATVLVRRSRRSDSQERIRTVREQAIQLLADLRLFADDYREVWQRYLYRLKYEAMLSEERARTYDAQVKMYKARGKTQAATRAKKRAEKERDAAINKQRELEKALAVEKAVAEERGKIIENLPDAIKTELTPKRNYPPTMLEEGKELMDAHPNYGEKKTIDWAPLLKKYHYNPHAKNAAKNFVRAVQRYIKKLASKASEPIE